MQKNHTVKLSEKYRAEHPHAPERIDYGFLAPVAPYERDVIKFRIIDCYHETLTNIQCADWLSKDNKNKFIDDLKRDVRSYQGPLPITIGRQDSPYSYNALLDGKKLASPFAVGMACAILSMAYYSLPTEELAIGIIPSIGAGIIGGTLTLAFNKVTDNKLTRYLRGKVGLYGIGGSVKSAQKNLAANVLGASLSLAMTFATISTGVDALCKSDNNNQSESGISYECPSIARYSLLP